MKKLSLILASLLSLSAHAQISQQSVIDAYAKTVATKYTAARDGAIAIQKSLDTFLAMPTEKNLMLARMVWTESRKAYSQTEVYRFYGGPIDSDTGPEPLINSWPLDEVYIDSIIEHADLYPTLDAATLSALNVKDGEKNISTGYHGIEYLLWGQDTSPDGPGNRPASDFAPSNPLSARRAQYLKTIAQLLIGDLNEVVAQWNPATPNAYVNTFVKDPAALTNALIGVTKLSGSELSQERMFVALDTRSQEEEQSCFSDTTHFDILYDFIGIKDVLEEGVLDLIKASDPASAQEIADNIADTDAKIRAIPVPFDQAILNEPGRTKVMDAIQALESLTEAVRQGAFTIGVELP